MVESERTLYVKNQQKDLISDTFSKLAKLAEQEDSGVTLQGKNVILPLSFTGSPRYMMQNYLDAIRSAGFTDIPTCLSHLRATQIGRKFHVLSQTRD